jgi:hypothetical protein
MVAWKMALEEWPWDLLSSKYADKSGFFADWGVRPVGSRYLRYPEMA